MVHRVAKSRTRLKQLSTHACLIIHLIYIPGSTDWGAAGLVILEISLWLVFEITFLQLNSQQTKSTGFKTALKVIVIVFLILLPPTKQNFHFACQIPKVSQSVRCLLLGSTQWLYTGLAGQSLFTLM